MGIASGAGSKLSFYEGYWSVGGGRLEDESLGLATDLGRHVKVYNTIAQMSGEGLIMERDIANRRRNQILTIPFLLVNPTGS
jgi:hypothetical protein